MPAVTQHRTPHLVSHLPASWCTLTFLFQVPPGSTEPAGPPASDASSASRACQRCSAGTVTPHTCPCPAGARLLLRDPNSSISGHWGETQWVQTHHGHPATCPSAKGGERGALCPVGNKVRWGSLGGSSGRAHLLVGRDEETQSEKTTYPPFSLGD